MKTASLKLCIYFILSEVSLFWTYISALFNNYSLSVICVTYTYYLSYLPASCRTLI